MDIFALRDQVVGEYRDYFESFVNIHDEEIEDFVRERLAVGEPWPDAVLQLNPAYAPGPTLGDLAAQGVVTQETARFFGPRLRLHRHQEEALSAAGRREPYIVTTGTGSGKSLTYLVPIVDYVFRNAPERHTVRAVIVYPMNALINSQLDALESFRRRNWPDCPVRFARYTGQDDDLRRQEIIDDAPHILLTNYVMLEYMLVRPYERVLVDQMTRELQFLVMDELHVYRGRQGADVAMLMRRVHQRAGNRPIQFVGTSATLVSEGTRAERNARIAEVGSTLFGVAIPAGNVIDETLRRIANIPAPRGEVLRAAVEAPPPAPTLEALAEHPLAAWLEEAFGLEEREGRLVRRTPTTFVEGLRRLVRETGLDAGLCDTQLKATLAAGSAARTPASDPVFAFRLHQFLASGSSVYATLQHPGDRFLTVEGQYVAPGLGDGGRNRVLFPLAFCRECGQEHYLVSRIERDGVGFLVPRSPLLNFVEDITQGTPGFFVPERDGLWSADEGIEALPEFWLEERKAGLRVKSNYAPHVPAHVWARSDGMLDHQAADDLLEGWFQPRPLMLCLRCRAAYDLRQKSDFAKLATLSQTGRSTATTITTTSSVIGLGKIESDEGSRKVLSFTDNRQDASLQAGHLNDFVQVALLRSALARVLRQEAPAGFERIGFATFDALGLASEQFMREARDSGPGYESARGAMIALLQYRAFEDLRRAWRVAQPNLEGCGLMRIDYAGLAELADDDALWMAAPGLADSPGVRRLHVLRSVLDHLRSQLAIDADCLADDQTRQLVQRANQWLRDPWSIDQRERLRRSAIALMPGVTPGRREQYGTLGLGWRSAIGRYLRSRHTWELERDLTTQEVEATIRAVVAALGGHVLSVVRRDGADFGVQIKAGALRWEAGDGQAPEPDPVRTRSLHLRRRDLLRTDPNPYFERLYNDQASLLAGVRGREHTGQVPATERVEREKEFRDGKLKALFCSPTMELGVDIADLSVVHMRNVPPTPANYAQRSGRAGRGGKPALVLTFCSQGNAHDEHFFRNKGRMIAGAVTPARMDMANQDLVEAHLHSVWLASVGIPLGQSMLDLLELDLTNYPLQADKAASLALTETQQRQVVAAFQQVVGGEDSTIAQAPWYTEHWLEQTVRDAPQEFERALNRWRDLYRAAIQQRDEARRMIDRPRLSKDERQAAEKQEIEAKREIDLLLNQGDTTESDFYPYRYMASEGFLPGYNFPRLPLRALVSGRESAQSIDRPRFLGLSEFGPQNIIYHEGRKHRVTSCILPAGGLESRLSRARLCSMCGYVHPGEEATTVELCAHCGTPLEGHSEFPQHLFEQPTVRTSGWNRITSDEEERSREGYRITTHYRFAPDGRTTRVEVGAADDAGLLLDVLSAAQAELWRINHGWRRAASQNGFVIDRDTGKWSKAEQDDDDDADADPAAHAPLAGVKPYVTDSRNLLLLRPRITTTDDQAFLKTLAYALQRAIQFVYQVEEREVQVELIGEGEHQRLLLWEAAEGGTGVWERLLGDPNGFAELAREALRICHFDPVTGEDDPAWGERCTLACYDCLLSYSNQLEHRFLDRHAIRDYLLALTKAKASRVGGRRDYEEQYRWLLERIDPASTFERQVLDDLYQRKLRLPDQTQNRPLSIVPVQPDFYYERNGLGGICVFVDGPHHSNPNQHDRDEEVREVLRDSGFRVIAIRHDRSIEEQFAAYPDVFTPVG